MQVLFSRLTPAIFISLGNAGARRCNLRGRFLLHQLGVRGPGGERESRNYNTPEQGSHHHSPVSWSARLVTWIEFILTVSAPSAWDCVSQRCRTPIARVAKLSRAAITLTISQ